MKNIVAGNWKMNLGLAQSIELAQSIANSLTELKNTEVWIAPSSPALASVKQSIVGAKISMGSQNVHWEASGAFTGEDSLGLLRDVGCSFVLVGHSERRHVLHETDEMIAKRTQFALRSGIKTTLCIGETLHDQESGQAQEVIHRQLDTALKSSNKDELANLVVAYEPVWAIGTGKVATVEIVDSIHSFIRQYLDKNASGIEIPILYGGSVSPGNFAEIIAIDNVNGALVGGASLDPQKFLKLIEISENN